MMGFKVDESKVRILKRLQDKISNIPYPHTSLIGEELIISFKNIVGERTLSVSVPDKGVYVNGKTWLHVLSRYLDRDSAYFSKDEGSMTIEEILATVEIFAKGISGILEEAA